MIQFLLKLLELILTRSSFNQPPLSPLFYIAFLMIESNTRSSCSDWGKTCKVNLYVYSYLCFLCNPCLCLIKHLEFFNTFVRQLVFFSDRFAQSKCHLVFRYTREKNMYTIEPKKIFRCDRTKSKIYSSNNSSQNSNELDS